MGLPASVSAGSEHIPIRECNASIINSLGGHWSAPIGFEESWLDAASIVALQPRADEVMREFASAAVWAWKDPRSCFTFPFWRARIEGDPIVVISYRHPLEVAASLTKRNGFGVAHGLAMWEHYNRSLLRNAQGLRTIVVAYDDLTRDPVSTLASVHRQFSGFGVALLGTPEDAALGIQTSQRHHVVDVVPPDVLLPSQLELWQRLQHLTTPWESFAMPDLRPIHPSSVEVLLQRAAALKCQDLNLALKLRSRSRRSALRTLLGRVDHSPQGDV